MKLYFKPKKAKKKLRHKIVKVSFCDINFVKNLRLQNVSIHSKFDQKSIHKCTKKMWIKSQPTRSFYCEM